MAELDDIGAFCERFGFSVRDVTFTSYGPGLGGYVRGKTRRAGLQVVDGSGASVKVVSKAGARHAAFGMCSLDASPLRSFHRDSQGRRELWEVLKKGCGVAWREKPEIRTTGTVWSKATVERAMVFPEFSSWTELDFKLQASGAYGEKP